MIPGEITLSRRRKQLRMCAGQKGGHLATCQSLGNVRVTEDPQARETVQITRSIAVVEKPLKGHEERSG